MTRNLAIKFCLAILLSLPVQAIAGSFKTVPLKLFMDTQTNTSLLKIVNEGEEKVTVQLGTKTWSQDENGDDKYEDTKDIVFFPMMANIEKGGEIIVRVGYQNKEPVTREKTYRLFAEELPVTKPGEIALKFALRVGVPVFVKPAKEVEEKVLEGVELKDGKVLLKVKNTGNVHFMIGRITVTGLDKSGAKTFSKEATGWYVLSGATKTFPLDIPGGEGVLGTNTIMVEAVAGNSNLKGELNVDKSQLVKNRGDLQKEKGERKDTEKIDSK